jgi:hypothetical protein
VKSDLKEVGLNEKVLARLTPEGIKIYSAYYSNRTKMFKKLRGIKLAKSAYDIKNRARRGGWYEFQLWEFMQIFGPCVRMGGPILFKPATLRVVSEP